MSDWEAGRIGYYVPTSEHSAGHIEYHYPSLATQGMASHGFPPNESRSDEAERMVKAISGGSGYFAYPMLGGLSNEAIGKLSPREIAELVKASMWEVQVVEMGNGDGIPVVCYPPGDRQRVPYAACDWSTIEHYTLKPRSLASRVARWIGRGIKDVPKMSPRRFHLIVTILVGACWVVATVRILCFSRR